MQPEASEFTSHAHWEKKRSDFELQNQDAQKAYNSDKNIFYLYEEIKKLRVLDDESNLFMKKMIMQPEGLRRSQMTRQEDPSRSETRQNGETGRPTRGEETPAQGAQSRDSGHAAGDFLEPGDSRVSRCESEKVDSTKPAQENGDFRKKDSPDLSENVIKRIEVSQIKQVNQMSPKSDEYVRVIERFVSKNDLNLFLENVILDPEEGMFVLRLKSEADTSRRSRASRGDGDSLANKASLEEAPKRESLETKVDVIRASKAGQVSTALTVIDPKFTRKFGIRNLSHMTELQLKSFLSAKQEEPSSSVFKNNLIQVPDRLDPEVQRVYFVEEQQRVLEFEEMYIIQNQNKLQSEVLRASEADHEARPKSPDTNVSQGFPDAQINRERLISHVDFVIGEEPKEPKESKESKEIEQDDVDKVSREEVVPVVKRFVTIYYNNYTGNGGRVERLLSDVGASSKLADGPRGSNFLKQTTSFGTPRTSIADKKRRTSSKHRKSAHGEANGNDPSPRASFDLPEMGSPEGSDFTKKKRALVFPITSNQNVHHYNCAGPKSAKTAPRRKLKRANRSKSKSKSRFYPPHMRTSRPISYKVDPGSDFARRRLSPRVSPRTRKKASRFSSPVIFKKHSKSRSKKSKGKLARERMQKIKRFKQGYYDKHPELYVEMMSRFERAANEPGNSWNLDGPSFASFLPSNRDYSERTSRDLQDTIPKRRGRSPVTVKTSQRNYYEKNYPLAWKDGARMNGRADAREPNSIPEPADARGGEPQSKEGQFGQHFRKPTQPVQSMKHVRREPVEEIFEKKSEPARSRNFSPSPFARTKPETKRNRQIGTFNEKETGAKAQKKPDPNLHPLQFCNFCDDYFHEKCFDDYFEIN